MANNNIIRQWNGRTIRQREDGYLSATDMCQACGKRWNNWNQLDSTKVYLEALRLHRYCDSSNGNLVDTQQGGIPENQGTWVHRKVALRLAQWLSPDFAVQVDDWVEELLLTGKVELANEPPKVITSFDRANAVNSLAASLQFLGMEIQNPRFKQGVQDLVGDMLGLTTNYLPESEPTEQWFGVAERAEQLGYSKSSVVERRIGLGKFVKKQGLTSRMEKRLCNGTQREINLYLLTEELDRAINQYMQLKGVK
jgi:KilA-N domain